MKNLPKGESPQTWRRYDVGFTDDGYVQVWCERCDMQVVAFPIQKDDEKFLRSCDDGKGMGRVDDNGKHYIKTKYDWGV